MTNEDFRFWRLKERNGIKYLFFEGWQNVKVFYSTRIGGVSPAPYDTLNLHYGRGDDAKNVEINRKRFFGAISVDDRHIIYSKQLHSSIVNIATDVTDGLEGDGMLTNRKGLFLGVFTADCLAVFLYSPVKDVIGVMHIGRRGAEKGIVGNGIDKICETFKIGSENIEALFGPSIGPSCYEVGMDFLKRFDRQYFIRSEKNIYLDMWKIVKDQLKENGVRKVLIPELCSCSRDDLFFSYRKSGEKVGENLGIIGMTNVET